MTTRVLSRSLAVAYGPPLDNQRALLSGNLTIISAAASEMEEIALEDALRILVIMATQHDLRYERAAAKWTARATSERQLALQESRRALALVEVLPETPEAVAPALRRLISR